MIVFWLMHLPICCSVRRNLIPAAWIWFICSIKALSSALNIILYSIRVLDPTSDTNVTCYATEDAVRIVNSFITIPITRNYNHNYFLRCATFTQLTIIHVRDYNHLLHSYTGWPQLSITVPKYHTLYIFTLWNSRRELTPRIHFSRLLLNNWLVGLLLTNCLLHSHSGSWTKPANSFAYIAELC
jgi:hypothetical protein